jgi:hypothetical protein
VSVFSPSGRVEMIASTSRADRPGHGHVIIVNSGRVRLIAVATRAVARDHARLVADLRTTGLYR